MNPSPQNLPFFFFNDTATTEIYTLSLHDALPIYEVGGLENRKDFANCPARGFRRASPDGKINRSEEHTSELQSQSNLVCRLLLEKKKKKCSLPFLLHYSSIRHTSLSSSNIQWYRI